MEPRELSDFSNYLKAKHMVAKYIEDAWYHWRHLVPLEIFGAVGNAWCH